MDNQSVFTIQEISMDRLHNKLEYIVSNYFITSLSCYQQDGQHCAVVVAVRKSQPIL